MRSKDNDGCCDFDPDPNDKFESYHYLRKCQSCGKRFWSLHCPHEIRFTDCRYCNLANEPLPEGVYDNED